MATKQNTPGLGIEYEVYVPALFALKLNNDPNVKDFAIRTNVAVEFGKMDDVVVDIDMVDNTRHGFAIQLKHVEKKTKKLIPASFECSGNFDLRSYCKSFNEIGAKNRNYHFILYTNREYDPKNKLEWEKFQIIQDENSPGRSFFDSCLESGHIYRFKVKENTPKLEVVTKEDYEEFFQKFTLYAGQKNFAEFREEIFDILKNGSAALRYLDLFRKCHQDRFTNRTIDKKTINMHLVDMFLSDFVITDRRLPINRNDNLELFQKIVKQFDITVINESKETMTADPVDSLAEEMQGCKIDDDDHEKTMIRVSKEYKLIDKTDRQLAARCKKKILCYLSEELLFIDFNNSSEESIYRLFELYHVTKNSIRFVLLGPVDSSKLSRYAVFENLNDLHNRDETLHLEVNKRCRLSLQGKDRITLEQLIDSCGKSDFIDTKDILMMLQDDFAVGEDRETVPVTYIPRRLSTDVLKLDTILKEDFLKRNTLIVDSDAKFETVRRKFEEESINIIERRDYLRLSEPPEANTIISAINECSMKSFREVIEKFHIERLLHLKIIDSETFEVMFTTDYVNFDRIYIKEEIIDEFLNSRINIVCAEPGMGKSTMFKILKNRLSNVWTVLIDLKAHYMFLKTKRPILEVLTHFLGTSQDGFLERIKAAFLVQKEIIFFFDGLDELDTPCVDNLLDYCEGMSNLGLRVWISSRQNLEHELTSRLFKRCIRIEKISTSQQEDYIRNRLRVRYRDEEIETILSDLHVNHNYRLPGIPLQLYIITQIFLDDEQRSYAMAKDIFVTTKMYKIFFDGRYKQANDKLESKHSHLKIEDSRDHFEKYEMLALQVLFDDDTFLALNLDTRRSARFLEDIKTKRDPLGIIVNINKENKAVFEQYTFAEYFASVFLADNFSKAKILQKQLYSFRCKNLLFMFNVMLAEDNPLHLAIIYNDVKQVEAYRDDPNIYDKGGRSPLHIAVSSRSYYPGPLTLKRSEESFPTQFFCGDLMHKDISFIKPVIKFNPLEYDKVFNWNCVDYAFARDCLFAAELILTKYQVSEEARPYLKRYRNDGNFAYFCVYTGSVNLLSINLGENLIPSTKWRQESLLHDAVSECFYQKFKMLRFLIKSGVDVDSVYENITPLQLAVLDKYLEEARLLIDNGATTNVIVNGETLLHIAFQRYHSFRSRFYETKTVLLKDLMGTDSPLECEPIDLVTELMKKDIPINAQNSKSETALHLAVATGDQQVVKFLLDNGADSNIRDKNGATPLHWAIQVCASSISSSEAIDIDIKNINVVSRNNSNVTKLLIEKGADVNVLTSDGKHCLQLAVYGGDIDTVILLLDRLDLSQVVWTPDKYPLSTAMQNGVLQRNLLLELTKSVKMTLHLAVATGDQQVVKFLLDNGADSNIRDKDDANPLHWVIQVCANSISETIDVDIKHINVVSRKNSNVTKLLIQQGADVNVLTSDGKHCLQLAVYGGDIDTVILLLGRLDLSQVVWTPEKYLVSTAMQNGVLQRNLLLELTKKACGATIRRT